MSSIENIFDVFADIVCFDALIINKGYTGKLDKLTNEPLWAIECNDNKIIVV